MFQRHWTGVCWSTVGVAWERTTVSSERAVEVESKFEVHGLFALPDLAVAVGGGVWVRDDVRLTLRATYYDSADLRLARSGVTLRHRTGEGADRWTLKLPAAAAVGVLSREEVWVQAGDGEVPAELRDLLTAWGRGVELGPVGVLLTEREVHVLVGEDGVELVEVADDTVSLLDGERVVSRFREVEVERREDSEAAERARAAAGRALVAAGAVAGDQQPKLVRALGPRALLPGDLPAPPAVSRKDPAGDLVLLALRIGLARLVGADVGVRRFEPDAVHQMRVACRRLRSDLRSYRTLLDDPRLESLRAELKWLADSLGAARDLEVLRARLVRTAAADPLSALDGHGTAALDVVLAAQEQDTRPVVLGALRSPRYIELLELLLAVAREPGLSGLAAGRCSDVLPALVGAAWDALAKRARKLREDDPDDSWHQARILAKRARYAAEAAAAAVGEPARRTGKAAASVQELLGEHQDAAVAAERVLAVATDTDDRVLAVTCARLAERERAAVHTTRRAFTDVWAQADTKPTTTWLRG